jgi:hypothetical protein
MVEYAKYGGAAAVGSEVYNAAFNQHNVGVLDKIRIDGQLDGWLADDIITKSMLRCWAPLKTSVAQRLSPVKAHQTTRNIAVHRWAYKLSHCIST